MLILTFASPLRKRFLSKVKLDSDSFLSNAQQPISALPLIYP